MKFSRAGVDLNGIRGPPGEAEARKSLRSLSRKTVDRRDETNE
jgi:hypothetical protein